MLPVRAKTGQALLHEIKRGNYLIFGWKIDDLNLDNFILYIRFYGVLSLQNLSAMIYEYNCSGYCRMTERCRGTMRYFNRESQKQ